MIGKTVSHYTIPENSPNSSGQLPCPRSDVTHRNTYLVPTYHVGICVLFKKNVESKRKKDE